MSERVPNGWYVKDGAYYVTRKKSTGPHHQSVLRSDPEKPTETLSRADALRLLGDWLDAGYTGRLVRTYRPAVEPAYEDLVRALRIVIEAYDHANSYRISEEGMNPDPERVREDACVNDARKLLVCGCGP